MVRSRLVLGAGGVLTAAALAVTTQAAVQPFWRESAPKPPVAISAGGTTTVSGWDRSGTIRLQFTVPRTWKRTSARGARSWRFASRNSCAHTVTVRQRLVLGDEATATSRATDLLPATGQYVYWSGTRNNAAYRVIRVRGGAEVRGVLVQPLATRYSGGAPAGRRVYAELSMTGVPDRRRECHAGGPRSIGEAIADAFAAGSAGGFVSGS